METVPSGSEHRGTPWLFDTANVFGDTYRFCLFKKYACLPACFCLAEFPGIFYIPKLPSIVMESPYTKAIRL